MIIKLKIFRKIHVKIKRVFFRYITAQYFAADIKEFHEFDFFGVPAVLQFNVLQWYLENNFI